MSQINLPSNAIIQAFEASYDGLHILDKYGNTLYINDACTRIEGTSKEEVQRKNIRTLITEGVYSQSVTLMVLEQKAPVTITQTAINGKEVLCTGTPVFGEDGEVEIVIVNSRDLTELSNLRHELSLQQYQLENLKLEHKKYSSMIANSSVMQKILRTALSIAKVDSSVLITGESGVGKGVLARFIHDNGSRAAAPFVKVDCSSIPESLIESELFGYEKGAFTGADQNGKEGLLELADGGTVFLDEIGEMPLSMQPKLMRAIQDLEIMPVGGKTTRKINVRFVAATNINLEEAVKEKKFRADLFYRLNVVPVKIPPLRERRDDILPLIHQMVEKINHKYQMNKSLDRETFDCMVSYEWPGNVRQLENTVERVMVSTDSSVIRKDDLPAELLLAQDNVQETIKLDGKKYKELLARYDKSLLEAAIAQEGSIPKAAKYLGIDATTIRRKLDRYKEKKEK